MPHLFQSHLRCFLRSSFQAPSRRSHRKGLPRSLSAVLILSSVVGVAAVAVTLLRAPAQEWLDAAPRTVRIIEQKFRPTADVLHQIDAVTDRAGRLTDGGDSATGSPSRVTLVPVAARRVPPRDARRHGGDGHRHHPDALPAGGRTARACADDGGAGERRAGNPDPQDHRRSPKRGRPLLRNHCGASTSVSRPRPRSSCGRSACPIRSCGAPWPAS